MCGCKYTSVCVCVYWGGGAGARMGEKQADRTVFFCETKGNLMAQFKRPK